MSQLVGSLTNRLMERTAYPEPEVGMGATECLYTDRHAYTVVRIKSKNRIIVRRDIAKRVDNRGMTECQDYEYIQDPNGDECELIRTKRGWKVVGRDIHFALGFRSEYYDYSF